MSGSWNLSWGAPQAHKVTQASQWGDPYFFTHHHIWDIYVPFCLRTWAYLQKNCSKVGPAVAKV